MTIRKEEKILFLPALCILTLYIFTQHFVVGSGLEKTATALAGFLALGCFARGWRLADRPAVSIWWSVLWSLVGAAIPFLAAEFVLYGDLDFLGDLWEEVFLPILSSLCLFLVVLALLLLFGRREPQKKTLWYGWLLWLGAVYLLLAVTGSIWSWDTAFFWFWIPLVLIGLPFLLPALYRGLKRLFPRPGVLPAVLYFLLSALLYALTTDVFYGFVHGMTVADPVVGLYQIVLCILIFWGENKADPMVSRPVEVALSAVYGLGCLGMTFLGNERLREILFHLGGPAVLISKTTREDWLGYHVTAALSFFKGDLGIMDAAFADTKNNYYQWFAYEYSTLFSWLVWIFAAVVILTVVELVLLMRSRLNSPQRERCKKYLVLGISLRLVLAAFCMVGMFGNFLMDFPFTGAAVLDFLYLWFCLRAVRQNSTGSIDEMSS